MTKHISFHRHEVVGAKIVRERLRILGFSGIEIDLPERLVRLHQVRFYPDTSDKTYRIFLRKLGKGRIVDLMMVLAADRAGNDNNKGKVRITSHMKRMDSKLRELEKTTIFEHDLCIKDWMLIGMGVDLKKIPEAMSNMVAIVQSKPNRNTKLFLTNYIEKNYLEKKNERFRGIPNWD